MAQYYVVRDKNTGLYFRGKGVNRWGKHYNQASIYRVRKMAENTIKEVSWRGEQAEIVPIQIVETAADVVPKSEVAMEIFEEIEKTLNRKIARSKPHFEKLKDRDENFLSKCGCEDMGYFKGIMSTCEDLQDILAELKKKYTEDQT